MCPVFHAHISCLDIFQCHHISFYTFTITIRIVTDFISLLHSYRIHNSYTIILFIICQLTAPCAINKEIITYLRVFSARFGFWLRFYSTATYQVSSGSHLLIAFQSDNITGNFTSDSSGSRFE